MHQLPVCREFTVNIHSASGLVREAPLPTGRESVASYLASVLPGVRVEYVGSKGETVAIPLPTRGWPWDETVQNTLKRYSEAENQPPTVSLFFQAIHACFAGHHPLAIRPDVLLYLITHEVAQCVKLHPESYRELLTKSSAGKELLEIRNDELELGNPKSPWHQVLGQFETMFRQDVPLTGTFLEHTRLLENLSTDTQESKCARCIAFADMVSPFYEFCVMTACGIPRIRLLGSARDYATLADIVSRLGEYFQKHMGSYFTKLASVTLTLADQALGAKQDDQFWRSIYSFESASGGDFVGGWAFAFVHWIQNARGHLIQKPQEQAIEPELIPSMVSHVPFEWKHMTAEGWKTHPMAFVGGVLGIDDEDGCLAPRLSYAIVHKPNRGAESSSYDEEFREAV